MLNMPNIKPVPIKTKGMPFWKQIYIWLTAFRQWEVIEDYYFFVPWLDVTVKIPQGFIFDGASIPRIFWLLLSPTGILFIPGLFHDYGYKYNYWLDENGNRIFEGYGQKFFDNQFGKLGEFINDMKVLDKVAWAVLRSFGWIAWNNHRKNDTKE
jgi:hypothetical protein